MSIPIQPLLSNSLVLLQPLQASDFEELYALASDPLVWEQHPNKERWKREVFENFFKGAMESKGAFKITERQTGKAIGSSRYYDFDEADNSILIGYTFFGKDYWGKGYNLSVKKLMLDYIFQYVGKVYFHIGAVNVRSQVAISRLGVTKVAEQSIAYFGEKDNLNFVYALSKEEWERQQ